MRIYSEVVVDIASDTILSTESVDYSGQVALLKGSSSPAPPPEPSPVPSYEEEAEPLKKSVRDAERNKLKQRRGLLGTILTSPLGAVQNKSNILGG